MTRIIVLVIVVAVVIAACDKNKFQTKPTLTLKSMNGNIIPAGASLVLDFEFTDKEGDISNTISMIKIRTNKIKVPTIRDTIHIAVPEFPKKSSGVVQLSLDRPNYLESAQNPPKDPVTGLNQADTLMLRFYLKDQANNVSDTVNVGPVIVPR